MNIRLHLRDLKIDTAISVTQLHIRGQIWPLYTLILKVAHVLDNIIIYALFYLEIFVLTNLDFLLCVNFVVLSATLATSIVVEMLGRSGQYGRFWCGHILGVYVLGALNCASVNVGVLGILWQRCVAMVSTWMSSREQVYHDGVCV